jgi:hypothetical protein
VQGPARNHRLYLWLVPADAAGVWRTRLGEREALLNLVQRFQLLSGTLSLDGRELAVADGRLAGDRITFRAGSLSFSGRLAGDAIEGHVHEPADLTTLAWTARRLR